MSFSTVIVVEQIVSFCLLVSCLVAVSGRPLFACFIFDFYTNFIVFLALNPIVFYPMSGILYQYYPIPFVALLKVLCRTSTNKVVYSVLI